MQQGLLSAFNPSDAYSQNLRQPVQGDMTLGNLVSYFMPISKNVMPYEDSPRLGAGDYNFDFPQVMKDAYSGINKFGQAFRGELSPQELQQLATNTAFNVAGGSLLGSRVIPNAVPKGGILGMGVSKTPNQTGLLGKANKSSNIFGSVEKFPNLSKQEENLVSSSFAPVNEVAGFGKVKIEKINNQDLVGSQKRFEELKKLTANYAHDRAKARVIRLDNGENAIQYMQPPTEIKNVNISDLIATQDNIVLGTNKSSGSPLAVKKNGKLYIRDGHHRIAQKINAGDKTTDVRVIDLDEGGYYGMDKSATNTPKTGLLGKNNEVIPENGLLGKVDNVQPKSGIAEVVPPTDKADGIFAFHGSGADFDEFKLSKIGTGEGNQAFGYGLYFTDSEDIAKFYKNAMSQKGTEGLTKTVDYKGKKINIDNIETNEESFVYANANLNPEITKNKLFKEKKRIEKEIATNNQAISQIQSGKVYKSFDGTEISEIEFEKNNKFFQPKLDAINKVIDNLSEIKIVDSAKTYEVKINAVMDDLIDYDKSLGQQSDNIKNILNKMKSEVTVDDAVNLGFDPFDFAGSQKKAIQETIKSLFGKDEDVVRFLNNWSAIRGEQATGEKLLAKYGAKGIKYKADQGVGARNVPETGKNNYVIFDDKIIDIMKKYGIVGAVGVTAMQGGEQSPEANLSL